jgi:hypothetical protein
MPWRFQGSGDFSNERIPGARMNKGIGCSSRCVTGSKSPAQRTKINGHSYNSRRVHVKETQGRRLDVGMAAFCATVARLLRE